jgi:hypothetical protein
MKWACFPRLLAMAKLIKGKEESKDSTTIDKRNGTAKI